MIGWPNSSRRWLQRRLSDQLHWPKQIPKRYAILGSVLSLFCVYFLLHWGQQDSHYDIRGRQCVEDYLTRKGIAHPWEENNLDGTKGNAEEWPAERVVFVGNGHIGLDAISDRQLLIFSNESGRPHLFTGFYPLMDVQLPFADKEDWLAFVEHDKGTARIVQCSRVADKCVCVGQSVFAHRTKLGCLIQDFKVVNPSTSSFSITFLRPKASDGWSQLKSSQSTPIFSKVFPSNIGSDKKTGTIVVAMCSAVPANSIPIKPKVEENFRFMCVVESELTGANGEKLASVQKRLIEAVSAKFAHFYSQDSQLDKDHLSAWKTLHAANFHISKSKAPNALNNPQIEAIRHALLSSVRILDTNTTDAGNNALNHILSVNSPLCYSGHSTLLTPSKLWQRWTDLRSLLRTMSVWKMTLEHRGCSKLIRSAGAHGFAQAILLSLLAGTFNSDAKKLELGLRPESELHRQIRADGLRVGEQGLVSLDFQLDLSLKPFVTIHNLNPEFSLFACTAGCQESPYRVEHRRPISLSIKITRPPTPILFLSERKPELELVKKTMHVIEVVDADTFEQHQIDLHKHGQSGAGGGLPTVFWVLLILLIAAFHCFLFKLLYSEWVNSSNAKSVPYSKFNKNVLFRR